MALSCCFSDEGLHGFQIAAKCAPVYIVVKAFQVDVQGIDPWENRIRDLFAEAAVGDQHRFQLSLPQKLCRVQHVFIRDQRFVIRKGDPDVSPCPKLCRHACQRFRGKAVFPSPPSPAEVLPVGHGDLPVLAEGTVQVAAIAADRQDAASGEEFSKRLLLDRVKGKGSDPPVVQRDHFPVLCPPAAASAALSFRDAAMMRADRTDCKALGRISHGEPPQSVPFQNLSPAPTARLFSGRWKAAAPPYPRRPGSAAASLSGSPW